MARAKTKLEGRKRISLETGQPVTGSRTPNSVYQEAERVSAQAAKLISGFKSNRPANIAIPTSISSDSMRGNSPVTVPSVPRGTAVADIVGQAGGVINSSVQLRDELNTAESEARAARDASRNDLKQTFGRIQEIAGSRSEAEERGGIGEKTQRVTDLTNQIEAKQLAITRQVEKLEDSGGGLESGQNIEVNRVVREGTRELADLAIVQSAANRDLITTQSIIDRKIELELEPLKAKFEFDKMFYQENQASFDKAYDRALTYKIQTEERVYQEARQVKTQIGSIQLMAAQYGATPQQIAAISNASTVEGAIAAAGNTLGAPFALQVRAQAFSEAAAAKADAAAEKAALVAADEVSLKVGSAFVGDERVQQFQISDQAYNRLNAVAPDRNDATFEEISGNDAAERAIVTNYLRLTDPDKAKLVDSGDLTASKAFDEQVESYIRGVRKDKATLPGKLKELATTADKLYSASVKGLESATADFNSRLTSGVILPSVQTYGKVVGVPVSAKLTQAEEAGYSPTETVDFLTNDPLLGMQIKKAIDTGWSKLDIYNWLKTQ